MVISLPTSLPTGSAEPFDDMSIARPMGGTQYPCARKWYPDPMAPIEDSQDTAPSTDLPGRAANSTWRSRSREIRPRSDHPDGQRTWTCSPGACAMLGFRVERATGLRSIWSEPHGVIVKFAVYLGGRYEPFLLQYTGGTQDAHHVLVHDRGDPRCSSRRWRAAHGGARSLRPTGKTILITTSPRNLGLGESRVVLPRSYQMARVPPSLREVEPAMTPLAGVSMLERADHLVDGYEHVPLGPRDRGLDDSQLDRPWLPDAGLLRASMASISCSWRCTRA